MTHLTRKDAPARDRTDNGAISSGADLYLFVGDQYIGSLEVVTDEPLGMFEAIYAGAEAGAAKPPWDYGAARPQLVEWADAQEPDRARWTRGARGRVRLRGRCRVPRRRGDIRTTGVRLRADRGRCGAPEAPGHRGERTSSPTSSTCLRELAGRVRPRRQSSLTVQSMPPELSTRVAAPQHRRVSSLREAPSWAWRPHAHDGLRGDGRPPWPPDPMQRSSCLQTPRPRPAPTRADRR